MGDCYDIALAMFVQWVMGLAGELRESSLFFFSDELMGNQRFRLRHTDIKRRRGSTFSKGHLDNSPEFTVEFVILNQPPSLPAPIYNNPIRSSF